MTPPEAPDMAAPTPGAGRPAGRGARVSLACVQCRTRHVRCDAVRPCCGRCASEAKDCQYTKSRRGGLDRAALAALAGRRAGVATEPASAVDSLREQAEDPVSGGQSPDGCLWTLGGSQPGLSFEMISPEVPSRDLSAGQPHVDFPDVTDDPFLDLYYRHFHGFHPCALPRAYLGTLVSDMASHAVLLPLISTLRYIGSMYGLSDQSFQLRDRARRSVAELPADLCSSPFIAQCRLLMSIALYWSGERAESRLEIDGAIRIALDLGMFRREFAKQHGRGDPVLEECWRRTWWQLYTVDANYAAIFRLPTFPTFEVDATTDLPCEESDYESGVSIRSQLDGSRLTVRCSCQTIPENVKTLDDFDSREFAVEEHVYSSFAYLVGAARALASAIGSAQRATPANTSVLAGIEAADAIINGFLLLLPSSKQIVIGEDGEIDELMFQTHMGIHA